MGLFDFFKKKEVEKVNPLKSDIFNHEYFGEIDILNLEEYYDFEMKIFDRKIKIDLNFESKSITKKELYGIDDFISKLKNLNIQNNNFIKSDLKNDVSISREYLDFYLEELDENELSEIIELKDTSKPRIELLLEKLNLIRVGIYYDQDYFATFDYSIDIDGEPCNQLLVLNVFENGALDYITWES